jgi:hexosaminidase
MITRRALVAAPVLARAFQDQGEPAVIPRPVRLARRDGVFRVTPKTRILTGKATQNEAALLGAALACTVGAGSPADGAINLIVDPAIPAEEAYTLLVSPQRVTIRASQPAGMYFGTVTLKQLVQGSAIPCVEIEDAPRFVWRGALVDPARHFKPKADVLRYIDALALHKINILQMHLTDDQGWRIEIKKYPKLTEVGSVRKHTRVGREGKSDKFDDKPHGGFYTQADIREIVSHAAARHITVVPEIEMPGHAQAALTAYPEFGNTGERLEVWGQWGVSKNIFSVSEKTFAFLEDVLSEVLALFPSRYIHVGGDEVPKDQWRASAEAQARMKQLGLKSEAELQTWFIGRINKFLRSRGRTLTGWDEIIEGGMTPGAVVMSWRGEKGGIEAARHGHDVVMTPVSHTYFDYYQGPPEKEPLAIGGFIDLKKVYSYEPVPAELSAEEAKRVLGTQGQLWSEYLPAASHMEYMAFPRMTALAEVAWTPKERRDYASFLRRLPAQLARLKAIGVNFRPL